MSTRLYKVITGLENINYRSRRIGIGIIIGTLIAIIRVLPKYRMLPRILIGFVLFMSDYLGVLDC